MADTRERLNLTRAGAGKKPLYMEVDEVAEEDKSEVPLAGFCKCCGSCFCVFVPDEAEPDDFIVSKADVLPECSLSLESLYQSSQVYVITDVLCMITWYTIGAFFTIHTSWGNIVIGAGMWAKR